MNDDISVEEVVEYLAIVGQNYWNGFWNQFHYTQSHELQEGCLGDEFRKAAIELIMDVDKEEDIIAFFIKIAAGLRKMKDTSYNACEAPILISEIADECNKKGCGLFDIIMRGQRDMNQLLRILIDLSERVSEPFEEMEDAYQAAYEVAVDLADIFHIALDMPKYD